MYVKGGYRFNTTKKKVVTRGQCSIVFDVAGAFHPERRPLNSLYGQVGRKAPASETTAHYL